MVAVPGDGSLSGLADRACAEAFVDAALRAARQVVREEGRPVAHPAVRARTARRPGTAVPRGEPGVRWG